jgi:hypothetical protein
VLVVVRVAGVVVLSGLAGELLGGSGLCAGVEVLDLGLAEDAVEGLVLGPASAVTNGKLTCRCCCWATCTPPGC